MKDRTNHSQVKNRYCRDGALSTPASETLNQIEAQPVADKAEQHKKIFTFETSN